MNLIQMRTKYFTNLMPSRCGVGGRGMPRDAGRGYLRWWGKHFISSFGKWGSPVPVSWDGHMFQNKNELVNVKTCSGMRDYPKR